MNLEKNLNQKNGLILTKLTNEHLEILYDINKSMRNPLSMFPQSILIPKSWQDMYKFARLVEPKEMILYKKLEAEKLVKVTYNTYNAPLISITPRGESLVLFSKSREHKKRKFSYLDLILL